MKKLLILVLVLAMLLPGCTKRGEQTPEPAPTPVPEEEDEVIVERMTESVSNAVASGVELVISAIADNAVSEKAAAVLVPVVKDVVGVAVEQLGEVVDLVEVSKTINHVHKMFTSLTKLIMELN